MIVVIVVGISVIPSFKPYRKSRYKKHTLIREQMQPLVLHSSDHSFSSRERSRKPVLEMSPDFFVLWVVHFLHGSIFSLLEVVG